MGDVILQVENLVTQFHTAEGTVSAVDDVSFVIEAGDQLGVVGESGSGKSAMVRSLVRLIDTPGRIEAGNVYWKGQDILSLSKSKLRAIRGKEIAMIFQESREALDPALPVGRQIVEALRAHRDVSRADARSRAVELLAEVGLQNPEENVTKYPHEYSGGMAQRAMIAIALASEPDLLIADEPTTGLDVTTQAQIIELLGDLCEQRDMAVIFITHDIGVVSEFCSQLMIMYAGRIVEKGSIDQVLNDPKHPYTVRFLESVPRITHEGDLTPIEGSPPNLSDPPSGCRFRPRCPHEQSLCAETRPPPIEFGEGHTATCYIYTDEYEGKTPLGAESPTDP